MKTISILEHLDNDDINKLKIEIEILKDRIEKKEAGLAKAKANLDSACGTKGYVMRLQSIEDGQIILLADKARLKQLIATLEEYELALIEPESVMQKFRKKEADLRREMERLRGQIENLDYQSTGFPRALANCGRPLNVIYSVSTGEGVIEAIRDPSTRTTNGKEVEDPGVLDKRLFIDVAEFGGILAQTKKAGSILSAVIRNAYDCKPLETNTRHEPVSVQNPYVSISGSITPNEFNGLLFDKQDIAKNADNGFSNRFIPLHVHRNKLVAMPTKTQGTEEMINGLWSNLLRVYQTLNPSEEARATAISMDVDAVEHWDREYKRITTLRAASIDAQRLHGRLETNTRKLAVILATMNGETSVSLPALKAAIAWIDYSAQTINKVVATAKDRMSNEAVSRDAQKVLGALAAFEGQASYTELARKLGYDKKQGKYKLEAAIARLTTAVPPVIEVINSIRQKSNGKKQTLKVIRLINFAQEKCK